MGATFSPLLHTSSESRTMAKLFYRVQLPCRRMDDEEEAMLHRTPDKAEFYKE
jgi:hypothetical protein